MREKYVEEKLRDEVKKLGGIAYKFESPGNNGVPDRIVILPTGIIKLVELKKPKGGRLSKLQIFQHKRLKDLGVHVHVISNIDEVHQFIAACKTEIINRWSP
jgi:hypothetical protein